MKKLILFLLLVCGATSVAAAPLRSGLYVGLKFGGDYAKFDAPWAKDADKKNDKDDASFAMAASAGFRVRHVRLEAEYMLMNQQKGPGGYRQDSDTLMAQLYLDLPFKSVIRPFVNAGMGVYMADIKQKGVWSDSVREFAWNAGGGLTWATSTATNLDVGYRYLNVEKFSTPNGALKQDNHIFYVGWRHVF